MLRARTPVIALLAAAVIAAPAGAETLDGTVGFLWEIEFRDTGEESFNWLSIRIDGQKMLFTENHLAGPPITSSNGCVTDAAPSDNRARCFPPTAQTSSPRIGIFLGGRPDRLDADDLGYAVFGDGGADADELQGGDMNDLLIGGGDNDILRGGEGPDQFYDRSFDGTVGGDDTFYGEGGNDVLYGAEAFHDGLGADRLDGGPGQDRAEYAGRPADAITVDLVAGTAVSATDADTLVDIEDIGGTNFPDVMTGNASPNRFIGNGGNDLLKGGAGNDLLEGGAGDDALWPQGGSDVSAGGEGNDVVHYDDLAAGVTVTFGDAGNVRPDVELVVGSPHADTFIGSPLADTIDAGAGADEITGGDGGDALTGGPGKDGFDAGGGDDTIKATDGVAEQIACGFGNDTVEADTIDDVFGDCETVTRVAPPVVIPTPTPGPGAGPGAPGTTLKAVLKIKGGKVRLDRRRRGRLQLTCTGAPCKGTLSIKAKRKTVATVRYSLKPGATAKVRFRLNTAGRRLLRKRKSLKATTGATRLTLTRR